MRCTTVVRVSNRKRKKIRKRVWDFRGLHRLSSLNYHLAILYLHLACLASENDTRYIFHTRMFADDLHVFDTEDVHEYPAVLGSQFVVYHNSKSAILEAEDAVQGVKVQPFAPARSVAASAELRRAV
ncbi:hypothetical protein L798_03011 [Zootermopsis nevadensis]|uniref:Uncharacterized protein n=1 Tax=Zootermopsis nevadensis TaxID=136037 RepID=A0A067QTP4_ZOONE|nr:hypothetical protein L798_03011 [Zootermopsis nevadensis]